MPQETFSEWAYGRIRERLLMYKLCQEAIHKRDRERRDKLLKQIKKEDGKEANQAARANFDERIRSHRYAWLDVAKDIISCPTNSFKFPEGDDIFLEDNDTKVNVSRGKYWPLSERDIKNFCVGVARKTRDGQPYRSYKPSESLMPVFKDFLIAENYLTENDLLEPNRWPEPDSELTELSKQNTTHKNDQSARRFDGDYRSKNRNIRLAIDHYTSFSFVKDKHWHKTRYIMNTCPITPNEDYARWRVEEWKQKRTGQIAFYGWYTPLSSQSGLFYSQSLPHCSSEPLYAAISSISLADDEKGSFQMMELTQDEFEAVSKKPVFDFIESILTKNSKKIIKFQRLNVKNLTDYLEIDNIDYEQVGRYRFVLPEETEKGDSLLRRLIAKFYKMNEFNNAVITDYRGRPAPDYVQQDLMTLNDPDILAQRMFWDVQNGGIDLDQILDKNVNINFYSDIHGAHILQHAAYGKSVGMIEKLIIRDDIDHLKRDGDGLLASQVALLFVDTYEIGERLMKREIEQAVERGIDPETLYKVGNATAVSNTPKGLE